MQAFLDGGLIKSGDENGARKSFRTPQMKLENEKVRYLPMKRGNPKTDSDIDVAIVVDKIEGDYFSTRPLLWRIGREVDDRIEPVILEKSRDQSGFLKKVMKNGIPI